MSPENTGIFLVSANLDVVYQITRGNNGDETLAAKPVLAVEGYEKHATILLLRTSVRVYKSRTGVRFWVLSEQASEYVNLLLSALEVKYHPKGLEDRLTALDKHYMAKASFEHFEQITNEIHDTDEDDLFGTVKPQPVDESSKVSRQDLERYVRADVEHHEDILNEIYIRVKSSREAGEVGDELTALRIGFDLMYTLFDLRSKIVNHKEL